MSPLIQTFDLVKTYTLEEVAVAALNRVTLDIEKGEMVSITGPSGCGKSTLMHLLGLLDTPTSGKIIFKGRDVVSFSEDERSRFRNREIGFIFQQFNLLQRISSLENVLLPTTYSSNLNGFLQSGGGLRKRAETLLSEVGLSHRLHHRPNQLSGGEQQRVAIARSLINDPSLVLADEPTGNLDSRSGAEILNILLDLNKKGKTLIIVTHDSGIAQSCQRVIRLKDGQLIS